LIFLLRAVNSVTPGSIYSRSRPADADWMIYSDADRSTSGVVVGDVVVKTVNSISLPEIKMHRLQVSFAAL